MPDGLPARFEIVSGPDRGVVLETTDAFAIGRDDGTRLTIRHDPKVSGHHAFVNNDGASVEITDLDSTNGTWVGAHRLNRTTAVHHGDVIRVGDTRIAVSIGHRELTRTDSFADGAGLLSSQLPASALQWLGNRRILREIGRGAMGIVYLIESAKDRPLAAKVIEHQLRTDTVARRRFLREAQIHCQLSHPNIVHAYELTEIADGMFCLVMDYVDGGNAEQLLRAAPDGLPPERVVQIASEVLDALGHAHRFGFVHRDVKTTNVLIDGSSGTAMLTDFGLAKMYEYSGTSAGRLTRADAAGGTEMFAAPEQLKDFRSALPAADIYSVGALAYRLLTAAFPYDLHGRGPLAAVMNHPLVPVRARTPSASEALAAVIETALSRDPAQRYPSAQAMAVAMREAIS